MSNEQACDLVRRCAAAFILSSLFRRCWGLGRQGKGEEARGAAGWLGRVTDAAAQQTQGKGVYFCFGALGAGTASTRRKEQANSGIQHLPGVKSNIGFQHSNTCV
jgi:hypothetical protein